jgi:hypothetical protein
MRTSYTTASADTFSRARRPIRRPVTLMFMAAALLMPCHHGLLAQEETLYPMKDRFADGPLCVEFGGGCTKYLGEFTDHTVGFIGRISVLRNFSPVLDAGLELSAGSLAYLRRERRYMSSAYAFQFGSENLVRRGTSFASLGLVADIGVFPAHYMNVSFRIGAGGTVYSPEDYRRGAVAFPEPSVLATAHATGGFAIDYFISSRSALRACVRYTLFLSDRLDAFPSEELSETYRASKNLPAETQSRLYMDSCMDLALGIRFFIPAR